MKCGCYVGTLVEAVRWWGLSSLWGVMSSAQPKWFNPSVLSNKHDCESQLFLNQGKRGEMSVFVESATCVAALWNEYETIRFCMLKDRSGIC